MEKISIQKNKLFIHGETIPLISGEIHYWRLPPYYWEKCLDRIAEMGLTIVATYVCWDFHEYEPEKCDFTGATIPERNLVEFLSLCQKKNFKVILRPGPYIYSEWPQAGVPKRVAPFHRVHPEFLRSAKEYIQQVTEAIRPFLFTNGGPIILLQADNEIDPFVRNYGDQLGVYGGDGLFQEFLREKYGAIDSLNSYWRSSLKNFSEAAATIRIKQNEPGEKSRAIDFQEFQYWCSKKIARWCVDAYRNAGVNVPIYLNTILNCISQNLREMGYEYPLIGIDLYPSNEFHASPDEHLSFFRNLSYTSAVTQLPYIPEFECGIWHNFSYKTGSFSSNHYRLMCLTALMAGIVGWNWYMLVERDNWYHSPINSRGYKRFELFEPMKKIVEVFNRIQPAELTKLTHTAITEDETHFFAEQIGEKNSAAKAVYDSGISFQSYDILKGDSATRLLFYAGPQWMNRQRREKLLQFIEQGGTVVFFNTFPDRDEKQNRNSELPFQSQDGSTPAKHFQLKIDDSTIDIFDSVSFFRQVNGEPIVAIQQEAAGSQLIAEENEFHENLEVGKKFIIGYIKKMKKGNLVFIGCASNTEIIHALHQKFNIQVFCSSKTADVHSALFQRDENTFFLIVVNNGNESKGTRIELNQALFASTGWQIEDLFSSAIEKIFFTNEPSVYVELNRKDGTILKLSRFNS